MKLHELPDVLAISPSVPCTGLVKIPGSKSYANRACLVAALARGKSRLHNMLFSEDTEVMLTALRHLGVNQNVQTQASLVDLEGCAGRFKPFSEEIDVVNAGTAARFLTAALTLGEGSYKLRGNARMHERPSEDLVQALVDAGCELRYVEKSGFLPLSIQGGGFPGGILRVHGEKSSQYISALMLVAPYARKNTTIQIIGNLVSHTYVRMTQRIMQEFGVACVWKEEQGLIDIPAEQTYFGRDYTVEGDASSASYFFAAAAISGGSVEVEGVPRNSEQGDLRLLGILEAMGCRVVWQSPTRVLVQGCARLQAVQVDMNTMSDVAPTLAAVAVFADGETVIRNVSNMRLKECDRIAALTCELQKVGASVVEFSDGLAISAQKEKLRGAELATYNDHRMAMSLSLLGLKLPGMRIQNPRCVAKTFPDFFERFFALLAVCVLSFCLGFADTSKAGQDYKKGGLTLAPKWTGRSKNALRLRRSKAGWPGPSQHPGSRSSYRPCI